MQAITNTYVFKPYNPIFAELFEAERNNIENAIGKAFPVLHMGSTAVPGLGGKGIIDIYVVVPAGGIKTVSGRLIKIGYEFDSKAGTTNRLFHYKDLPDPIDGVRRYHVHVVAEDSADFLNSLTFRNYLRKHPKAIQEYAKVKEYAASIPECNKTVYMSIKEPIIKKINKLAFYEEVKSIPKGKVATYGQLAKICGFKTPRYVGYLLSQNTAPEKVPCHRVIHSDGTLAGNYAFGGLGAKRKRLEGEGVEIVNNRVDLNKFGWIPGVKFDD